jgi:hypothetical protein
VCGPGGGREREGAGPTTGEGSTLQVKAKWVAGRGGYAISDAGGGGGADVWVWMSRIRLGMVGLRYDRFR